MGVTVAPGDVKRSRDVTRRTHDATPEYDVTSNQDLQRVYLDFLRSQWPTTSYGLDKYLTTSSYDNNEAAYDDSESNSDQNDDEVYDAYDDVIVEPTSRAVTLQSAAKELSEKLSSQLVEKLPKSLSSKCIMEGGTCASFSQCDTTSHIYKGYCATDYSSVCCVPRQTVCQANDGICTSDRQACVAAGEIMGRKYNLRFYTWMDCNSTHVCCRPSQAFIAPKQAAASDESEDNDVSGGGNTDELEDDDYEEETSRKRKPSIGKRVRAPKGFRGAVNPEFEEYADDSDDNDDNSGGERVVRTRGRPRVNSPPRRNGAILRRSPPPVAQSPVASPLIPAYGFPLYQQQQGQPPPAAQLPPQPLPPPPNAAPRPVNAYTSNSALYPNIVDYVATYTNTNPVVPSRGNAYAASYPDQGTLVTQNRLPVQASYSQGSSAAAHPSSLFGNIFL